MITEIALIQSCLGKVTTRRGIDVQSKKSNYYWIYFVYHLLDYLLTNGKEKSNKNHADDKEFF